MERYVHSLLGCATEPEDLPIVSMVFAIGLVPYTDTGAGSTFCWSDHRSKLYRQTHNMGFVRLEYVAPRILLQHRSFVCLCLLPTLTEFPDIVAASASSVAVQEAVINTTHAFLTNGLNNIPFGTRYNVEGPDVGKWTGNKARSTVGSDFALLALSQGTWGIHH